jgi:hypothetical protein
MDTDARVEFIKTVFAEAEKDILAKAPRMPEHWTGLQIKRFLTEYFKERVDMPSRLNGNTKQGLEYKNDVIRNNLL